MATRKCSSLKKDEHVVFRYVPYGFDKEYTFDGTVMHVDINNNIVEVSIMEGYKETFYKIPFDKMLGVYNPKGEYIDFDGVKGYSDYLEAD